MRAPDRNSRDEDGLRRALSGADGRDAACAEASDPSVAGCRALHFCT
jgi:hypothetical protein